MSGQHLERLRVVVMINAPENNERKVDNNNNSCVGKYANRRNSEDLMCFTPPVTDTHHIRTEVKLIDSRTVQLDLWETNAAPATNICHKMTFDRVSHASAELVKAEVASVMDELLLKRRSCCIMRFATKREFHVTVFFNLLITEINRRLQQLKAKVQSVQLDCNDIAGDVKAQPERGTTRNAAHMELRANTSGESANTIRNQFRNTRELLLWLLNEYGRKWCDFRGHENLQFRFSVVDSKFVAFKVQLSFFNIYLNKMNADARVHWQKYMEHMGQDGCRGRDCDFLHSSLTENLTCQFEAMFSGRTLLLFDVPTDESDACDTVELLQMAHAAVKQRNKKQFSSYGHPGNPSQHTLLDHSTANCSSSASNDNGNGSCSDISKRTVSRRFSEPLARDPNLRSVSFTIPIERSHSMLGISYSKKDLRCLSSWYRKIDERFNATCSLREKYYQHYFDIKITQICGDIWSLASCLEEDHHISNIYSLEVSSSSEQEILSLCDKYRAAENSFKQLKDQVGRSIYKDVLKTYLETKEFDLAKHASDLKVKQLESCQQCLDYVFEKNGIPGLWSY